MADASATTSSNTTCKPIDEKLFDLGCLGPALVIIVILACLKKRKKLKLEYCNGYPGLLIPINFLGSRHNRFTIAATFGATASTCVEIFSSGGNGVFSLGGPAWAKIFQGLISILVYGILFYPLFVCLTTDYKLVGSFLGFLYAFLRFCFKLAIDFECMSSYEGDKKKLLYIEFVGHLPTYVCLVFITIRFAVLLFMEVRKKWFQSESGINVDKAGETGETCLVGKSEIEHVKKLINPGLNSALVDMKWYMKVIYFIYKPRSDFKFSTQLISTVVVAVIVVFQICVSLFGLFELLKTACTGNDIDVCLSILGVLMGGLQAAYVISALISVMFLLQFMKCHRDHMLQLYRGERTFYQHMSVSPAKLVGRSLRFSGYQVAYTLAGYSILGFFLWIVCTILAFVFKYMKQFLSPEMFELFKQVGIAALPTVGMAVVLWLFQLFLAHFVFRDRDFPNITITVDNRRLFSIMSYFFFFYNILLGLISIFGRIFKGMVLGIVFLSRIDRTSLMQGFQTWDQAFVAYLGFVNVLEAHSHPVMLMFCQLLINRNKDGGLVDSPPDIPQSVQRSSQSGRATAYTRELRLTRLSQKAVNRWHVAVTLLFNPSLIKYRKQSEVRDERTASLRSIQADVSVLVY